jgi:hypothetical protein
MANNDKEFYRLMNRVYIRDGDKMYYSGAALLAMLMHTHGEGRNSEAMTDIRRVMKDHNLKR